MKWNFSGRRLDVVASFSRSQKRRILRGDRYDQQVVLLCVSNRDSGRTSGAGSSDRRIRRRLTSGIPILVRAREIVGFVENFSACSSKFFFVLQQQLDRSRANLASQFSFTTV